MRYVWILFFRFAMFAGLAACMTEPAQITPGPVGLVRLDLSDPVRSNWDQTGARPLATMIWYPAADGAEMIQIAVPTERPIFIGGDAAPGAEFIEPTARLPLIVMSHGTGGSAVQMMWLGRALAANGFIVAAVDHHGNTAAEDTFDPRGFRMPWERARDLSAVLDHLLADPMWRDRIDPQRIGAAGFSLGGYTVTLLAGGRMDLELLDAFCQSAARDTTCDEQSEAPEAGADFEAMLAADADLVLRMNDHRADYTDDRIKAVLVLAPALAQSFTKDSLAGVSIPYAAIGGDVDRIAPIMTNAIWLTARIPGAQGRTIAGGDHYAFLNRCSPTGIQFVPICKDPPGVTRAKIHQETIGLTLAFFRDALGEG